MTIEQNYNELSRLFDHDRLWTLWTVEATFRNWWYSKRIIGLGKKRPKDECRIDLDGENQSSMGYGSMILVNFRVWKDQIICVEVVAHRKISTPVTTEAPLFSIGASNWEYVATKKSMKRASFCKVGGVRVKGVKHRFTGDGRIR